jgi:6-phosphogluconolactonase (cycloisomerase 2 family)
MRKHVSITATLGNRRIAACVASTLALSIAALFSSPTDLSAACNLIPVAATSFASSKGGVLSPVASPGEIVQLELNGCDASPGFEKRATNNEVTITFEPPSNNDTPVVLNTFDSTLIKSVAQCTLPAGRCRTLTFEVPDTTGLVLPDTTVATNGLAGPAHITVRDLANTVVADVSDLNLPAVSCDKEPERVFQKFTVLPRANNFFDVDNGTTTQILGTVDGGNNLLVPFDYWGGGTRSVLASRPGAPEARFLEGDAPLEAFTGGGTTIGQVIAALPNRSDFVRSFTLSGRPLPPLLRVKTGGGGLYGAADAVASVLRIAINDGAGGPDLYDVTDRLSTGGRGPIVIGSPVLNVRSPLPLRSLRSSTDSVAYARDELRELANINPDADQNDLVTQVVDAQTADVFNTQEAVTIIASSFFAAPAIVASGQRVAYLLSERFQGNAPVNGDADTNDNVVRAFLRDGTNLAPAILEDASTGRLVDGQPLAISGSRIFFRGPGAFIDAKVDGVGGVNGLAGASGIAMSTDGKHVYVASAADNALAVFSRNAVTGELTFVEGHFYNGVNGLFQAFGVVVTPDGANVYVASTLDNAVAVFKRNATTGELTFIQAVFAGSPPPILEPVGIAVSPDSNFVYVASQVSNSIVTFERTGVNGELTYRDAQVNGIGGVTNLGHPTSVLVSPDGAHVYATADGSDSIVAFSRNVGTGVLTFIEAEVDGVGGVDGIDHAGAASISPDGRHLYVPGAFDLALAVFERNPGTGALTFVGVHFDGEDRLSGLAGATASAVSPDGQRVYVGAKNLSAVTIFRRNSETGEVLFEDALFGAISGIDGIGGAQLMVSDPTGKHLYVTGQFDNSVGVLNTRQRLKVLDTSVPASPVVLTTQPPSGYVAVSGDRAAFLRPESADGIDLNGDGDPAFAGDAFDDVVQLYDASVPNGAVTSLATAGNRVALSSTLVAFTVPEANEGATSLNPITDSDADDDILYVYEIGAPPVPLNVGVSADAIAVVGNSVVFITPEMSESATGPGCGATSPIGGCDLNGDMDANDRVLRVYRYDPTTNSGTIESIGEPAEEFVVGGSLVAFRSSEEQAGHSLNPGVGDTDTNDFVMRVYDIALDMLMDTERSAIPCLLPGCDPVLPYKASDKGNNRTVTFLTDEQEEGVLGTDLDLDGDANDIVLSMFNFRTGLTHTIGKVIDDAHPTPPPQITPFPDDPFDGTLVVNEVHESDIGQDVNLDGDLDDIVVVVIGDSDDDGTVDDLDVCRETEDDDQTDGDGDNLGDAACDPIPPPACGNVPRMTCRAPTEPHKASVQFKNSADPKKDQLKFNWTKGEQTALAAFGDPPNNVNSLYSLCVYAGSPTQGLVSAAVVLPGGRFCGKKRCWSKSGTSGFGFKDKEGIPHGITAGKLAAGGDGDVRVQIQGKGTNLELPELPLETPVTVQVVVKVGANDECWGATFSDPNTTSTEQFKAKSD